MFLVTRVVCHDLLVFQLGCAECRGRRFAFCLITAWSCSRSRTTHAPGCATSPPSSGSPNAPPSASWPTSSPRTTSRANATDAATPTRCEPICRSASPASATSIWVRCSGCCSPPEPATSAAASSTTTSRRADARAASEPAGPSWCPSDRRRACPRGNPCMSADEFLLHLALPSRPQSAALVPRALARELPAYRMDDDGLADLQLPATVLITNAIRHGR